LSADITCEHRPEPPPPYPSRLLTDVDAAPEPQVLGVQQAHRNRKYISPKGLCKPAHQQLKEELGLGHFQGRSRTGLRRHSLMTMIADAYLKARRTASSLRVKKGMSGG